MVCGKISLHFNQRIQGDQELTTILSKTWRKCNLDNVVKMQKMRSMLLVSMWWRDKHKRHLLDRITRRPLEASSKNKALDLANSLD